MSEVLMESRIADEPTHSMTTPYLRVTALFGDDVFFVLCEWGTKKPLVTYVERPFEGAKSAAYRALFEGGARNIAVYVGRVSGGLCAIDFDADEDLAAFLVVNLKLAGTLRTRGSRGGMLWMRTAGNPRSDPAVSSRRRLAAMGSLVETAGRSP